MKKKLLFIIAILAVLLIALLAISKLYTNSSNNQPLPSPWKKGQIVARGNFGFQGDGDAIERRFLSHDKPKLYLVQEFYSDTGNKFTDPFYIMEYDLTRGGSMVRDPAVIRIDGIVGPFTLYESNGDKIIEGYFDNEGYVSGHWIKWRDEKANERFWEGNFTKGEKSGKWKVWDWDYLQGRLQTIDMDKKR